MKQNELKLKIAIIICISLWGSAYVGIRAALVGYPPASLALLRFLVASLGMLFLYFSLSKRQKINLQELPRIFLIGVGIGIYNLALNHGELTIPAGIAAFILGMMPVITIIFSTFFLKEKSTPRKWFGVFISLTGLIVIAIGEHGGIQFDFGILFVLLAAIMGTIFTILQKPLLIKYHPIEVSSFMIWGGTLVLAINFPELIKAIPNAPTSATLSVIYLGIFPAAIAQALWSYMLSKMPASQAAPYLYGAPIVATFLAWILLSEIPVMLSLIGGIIALAGAAISTYTSRRKVSMTNP